jgi:hypothetical protein
VLYPLSGTAQLVGNAVGDEPVGDIEARVNVDASTGSAAAATVPTTMMVFGSGEWINTAAQITSVTMLTTGGSATMAAGSGFVVHGRNL